MNVPPKYCTGCTSCMNICPQKCIQMIEDGEGFLYPQIDNSKCIQCGVCEKVCAVLHKERSRIPISIYVAKNANENIRMESSSGGIFTLIAEHILSEGGVVFGAKFNERWEVIHDYTETVKGLAEFRGSKYVQSSIGNTFQQVKLFLKAGRKVLFTGTPCQIIGLKKYLRKEYENLLTIDFICHGVPSPKVWRTYLEESLSNKRNSKYYPFFESEKNSINKIEFRSKLTGWKNYSFVLTFSRTMFNGGQMYTSIAWENPYMRGFLSDLYLRPSCHHCFVKGFRSQSDITIADAWGIEYYLPQWNDDKGASLLCIFNKKSLEILGKLTHIEYIPVNDSVISKHNEAAYRCPRESEKRRKFFKLLENNKFPFPIMIDKCLPADTYWDKLIWSINKRIKRYVK